ncbi:MAG: transcriptional regulator [Bacteroidota bacterium]
MSFLKRNQQADFKIIKEQTGISAGNLSIQLNNLKNAAYIEIVKQFKGNYPLTICRITSLGSNAVEDFFKAIKAYEQILEN